MPARRCRALLLGTLIAGFGAIAPAPPAFAHAQLLGTSPESGATVATQPKEVIFKYNQNVGGTLGAVRVYNAKGEEVDNLDVSHPEGQEHWMGVGLKPGLPDGTYTATYRVISADTHIVYGGLVFNIGHAGAAPTVTVAGLIGRNKSGKVTEVAFGVVRGLDYVSIALLLGSLAFLIVAWLPGFASVAGPEREWLLAARMFSRRMKWLLIVAIVLGFLVSVLGILLQGASAAGVSLWSSLKSTVLENTLESRFGKVWGLRAIDWLALGILLAVGTAFARSSERKLSADAPEADAATLAARPPGWLLGLIAICAAYLAATPALSGHASIQSPTVVFFPSDVLHVLAASVWVGGIACLLFGPARGDQAAREPRSQPAAARDARPLLPARTRFGDRDRGDRSGAGIHRRAQPARPVPHHLRRADHRQDRAAAFVDLPRLGQPRTGDPRVQADRGRGRASGCGRNSGSAHDARGASADALRVRRDRGSDQLRAPDRRRLRPVLHRTRRSDGLSSR